jgi:putative ABC transport system permease protein
MNLAENIKLALRAISGNMLRSVLTLLIIAFGIMALVVILTATEGIKTKILSSFTEMGSNTFGIRNEGQVRKRGGGRSRDAENPPITLQQANDFIKSFKYPATISVSKMADGSAVVKSERTKTNPNVKVFGIDEFYLKVSGLNIAEGRNFSKGEIESGTDVILLGKDVVAKVFLPNDTVIGSLVNIGSKKYKVVGILASKGASQMTTDNQVLIPVINAKRTFPDEKGTYMLNVMVTNPEELDLAVDEAIGIFRAVRKLRLGDENDFDISKSERIASEMIQNISSIKFATIIIGILTLIGAGIGLMNIMLVSVNERTREIGVSKALGANKRTIVIQFLSEAVIICQIGGFFGIVLGVLLGNVVGLLLQTGFIFPWAWVISGFIFTFIIGLAAGIYPALKAADLNPVDALRYE